MFLIRGKMLGYTEENRGYKDDKGEDKSFLSRQIHVIDGVHVERLELTRDFDMSSIPERDVDVVIEVFPNAKNSRIYWKAVKVLEARPAVKAS